MQKNQILNKLLFLTKEDLLISIEDFLLVLKKSSIEFIYFKNYKGIITNIHLKKETLIESFEDYFLETILSKKKLFQLKN